MCHLIIWCSSCDGRPYFNLVNMNTRKCQAYAAIWRFRIHLHKFFSVFATRENVNNTLMNMTFNTHYCLLLTKKPRTKCQYHTSGTSLTWFNLGGKNRVERARAIMAWSRALKFLVSQGVYITSYTPHSPTQQPSVHSLFKPPGAVRKLHYTSWRCE